MCEPPYLSFNPSQILDSHFTLHSQCLEFDTDGVSTVPLAFSQETSDNAV